MVNITGVSTTRNIQLNFVLLFKKKDGKKSVYLGRYLARSGLSPEYGPWCPGAQMWEGPCSQPVPDMGKVERGSMAGVGAGGATSLHPWL